MAGGVLTAVLPEWHLWPALNLGTDFLCPAGVAEFRGQQKSLICLTQVVKPVKTREAANAPHRITVIMWHTQEVTCGGGLITFQDDTRPSGEFYLCVFVSLLVEISKFYELLYFLSWRKTKGKYVPHSHAFPGEAKAMKMWGALTCDIIWWWHSWS